MNGYLKSAGEWKDKNQTLEIGKEISVLNNGSS